MNKLKIKNSRFNNKQSSIWNLKSLMRSKGFTLMELMVVIAIMAILIIASMPVFRGFTRNRNLNTGTDMVVSALRKSREAAITYRKNYRVLLDTGNQTVGIDDDTDITNGLAENWAKLPEFVKFDVTVPPWYTGNTAATQNHYGVPYQTVYWIGFKPDGSLDGVGVAEQTVVLKEESTGDNKLVKVNALTGRIRVE